MPSRLGIPMATAMRLAMRLVTASGMGWDRRLELAPLFAAALGTLADALPGLSPRRL
jgi:hypothetical protein